MTDKTIRVRVARGEFRYAREHYERGEELDVHERALEKHPRTLERVESEDAEADASGSEAESDTVDEDDADEADLAFDLDDIDPHPSDLTVDDLGDRVEGVDDIDQLEAIRYLEVESKDRKGAKEAIDERLGELEG